MLRIKRVLHQDIVCNCCCPTLSSNQQLSSNRIVPSFNIIDTPRFPPFEFISICNRKPPHIKQLHQIQQIVCLLSAPVLILCNQVLPLFIIISEYFRLLIIFCKRIFFFCRNYLPIGGCIGVAFHPMPQFQIIIPAWVFEASPFITNFSSTLTLLPFFFFLYFAHQFRRHQWVRRTQQRKCFSAHSFWFFHLWLSFWFCFLFLRLC